MDTKETTRRLIDRYRRGEATDADIRGLSEPMQTRLQQERADREALRAAYERKQAQAATLREAELEAAHLAAGGTRETWRKEGPGIVAADRQQRTLDGAGARQSLVNVKSVI